MRFTQLFDSAPFRVEAMVSSAVSGVVSVATTDWTMGIFGVPLSVLLAGFAGAALALSLLPTMTHRQMAIAIALGTAIGMYGALIVTLLQPALAPAVAAVAFFLGLCGQFGASMFFKDGRDVVLAWIRRILGVSGSTP